MKKFVSSLVLFIYMFVSSPVVLIAQSIQQEKYYKEITVTKLIEKDKGGEVSLGRAKVVFPEGALKEDTEITIQALFTDENADHR
jgi:hypothetical protein